MKRASIRGFTLIELLVVIAILSVVTTLGTVTLVNLWAQWGKIRTITTLDRTADQIFRQIEEDLSAAVSAPIAGSALKGVSASEKEEPRYHKMDLASDSFTVPVETRIASGTVTVLAGYRIDRSGDISKLVRTQTQLRGGVESSSDIAKGVVEFQVQYAGAGGGWSETWEQPFNPRALRVSIVLVDPNRPLTDQTARQAIIPVRVP
ncbi:MAG: prepilin-type N-terminal cleavage/methylation domain-containing protein [Candidatus Hydrogenedentes bacterium]|nr:prepilin-type N-terminal cleavage/methylation domain-containing protein [Candidatus Hydrogenedentota bacterium]